MSAPSKFTQELRDQFLELLEGGATVGDACAKVGISRTTINKWAQRGRAGGLANEDAEEFAARFDAVQTGVAERERLSKERLIQLLERAAVKGSVQACRLLLEEPWEKTSGNDDQEGGGDGGFDALGPPPSDELQPRRAARG